MGVCVLASYSCSMNSGQPAPQSVRNYNNSHGSGIRHPHADLPLRPAPPCPAPYAPALPAPCRPPVPPRSLRMYNSLVERCFKDCVDSFRRKDLDATEEKVRQGRGGWGQGCCVADCSGRWEHGGEQGRWNGWGGEGREGPCCMCSTLPTH